MCGKLRKFHLVVCVNGNIFFLAPPWTPMTPDKSSWAIVSLLLFNIFCMMRAQMFELKILGCGGMFMRVASRCNYYFSRQRLPASICKTTLIQNISISEPFFSLIRVSSTFNLYIWHIKPRDIVQDSVNILREFFSFSSPDHPSSFKRNLTNNIAIPLTMSQYAKQALHKHHFHPNPRICLSVRVSVCPSPKDHMLWC